MTDPLSIVGTEVVAMRFELDKFDAAGVAVDHVYAECKNVTTWRMLYPSTEPHEYALVISMTERGSRPSLNKARRFLRAAGGEEYPVEDLPVIDGVALLDVLRQRRFEHALRGAAAGQQEVKNRIRMPSGFELDTRGRMHPRKRPQG